ncbi:6335_t:CDS:2 [Cetraspora pellucida]|uniref:6335_t:CDS:1 n=1 Tax=Cetraspora pellucida TaxID=1433469 RepID=A0ACA9MIK8_9GLOM|nr:6335_t:CDS:2 [Cetraspora pellucida]
METNGRPKKEPLKNTIKKMKSASNIENNLLNTSKHFEACS